MAKVAKKACAGSWLAGLIVISLVLGIAVSGAQAQSAYAADGGPTQLAAGDIATIAPQAKKAKPGKAKLVKAYKAVLKKSGGFQYAVFDINRDGVSELLVNAGVTNPDARWSVYTFKGGRAKYVGSFTPGISTLDKGKGGKLYCDYGHMGVWRFYRISMKGGHVRATVALTDTAELQRFPSATAFIRSHSLKKLDCSSASNYALLKKAKANLKKADIATTSTALTTQGKKRWNKARIDATSPNPQGRRVTLKGRIKRANLTPDQTGMGWGCAVTYLVFDKPVTITYKSSYGVKTKKYKKIQIAINPAYLASGDTYKAYHPKTIKGTFDKYLGKVKKVRGYVFDSGTAYFTTGGALVSSKVL